MRKTKVQNSVGRTGKSRSERDGFFNEIHPDGWVDFISPSVKRSISSNAAAFDFMFCVSKAFHTDRTSQCAALIRFCARKRKIRTNLL